MHLIGVDGVGPGWLVAWREEGLRYRVFPSLADAFAVLEPRLAAIDVPIGLADTVPSRGRDCEVTARALLGPLRASVFPTPPRAVVAATSYPDAAAACGRIAGWKPSRQAFSIFPKIREADALVRHVGQDRAIETHPELAFLAMKGGAITSRKSRAGGVVERLRLLSDQGLDPLGGTFDPSLDQSGVGIDDVLDATAALWTAHRVHEGRAGRLPADPPRDAHGLRMEIWF